MLENRCAEVNCQVDLMLCSSGLSCAKKSENWLLMPTEARTNWNASPLQARDITDTRIHA